MKNNIRSNNEQNRRQFLSSSAMVGLGLVVSAIPGVNALAMLPEATTSSLDEISEISAEPKVWLVTGSNRGNGYGIAEAAAKAGHKVIATARKPSSIPEFLSKHPNVVVMALDVTKQSTIDDAVKSTIEKFGKIDVLVNNAGYGQLGWFENTTEKQVRDQFETNVFGTMNVTRAVLPYLRKQSSGYIVTVTSTAGLVSVAGSSTYSASKFALEGWLEGLADELKPLGIGVTAVEPGFFRTDFLDRSSAIYADTNIPEYNPKALEFIEFHDKMNHHQVGDPKKLGEAIVKLAASSAKPLRFVAGTAAMDGATKKLKGEVEQISQLQKISSATDGNWTDTFHG